MSLNSRKAFFVMIGSMSVLLGVALLVWSNRSNPQHVLDQRAEKIITQINQDAEYLANQPDFGKKSNWAPLLQSNVQHQIYLGDSLIFWNHPLLQDTSSKDKDPKLFTQSYTQNNHRIFSFVSLIDDQGWCLVCQTEFLRFQYNPAGPYELRLKSDFSIPVEVHKQSPDDPFIGFLLLLSILAFIVLLWVWRAFFILKDVAQNNTKRSVQYLGGVLGISIAFICFSEFCFYGPWEKLVQKHPEFSLHHFFIVVISLYFILTGIRNSSLVAYYHKLTNPLKYMASAILVSGYFFFILDAMEYLISSKKVIIDVESILQIPLNSYLFVLAILLFSLQAFYTSILLFSGNDPKTGTIKRHIFTYIGILSNGFIFWMFSDGLPIVPIIIFLISYFLILDVFLESSQKNITYVLWWMLLFSGFIAIGLFYSDLKHDYRERMTAIQSVLTPLPSHLKSKLKDQRNTLVKSGLVESLSKIPGPATLDQEDIRAFITKSLDKQLTQSFSLQEIHCFDVRGNSLFFNQFPQLEKLNTRLLQVQNISENIFFNPIYNEVYFKFEIENLQFSKNQIELIIILEGHKKTAIQETNLPIYIWKGNQQVYRNQPSQDNFEPKLFSDANVQDTIINGVSYLSYATHFDDQLYRVVSTKKMVGLIKPLSVFSFVFSLLGILILTITFINTRIQILPSEIDLKFYNRNSLTSKIQLSVILLIIFSFIVIGLITAFYFNNILKSNAEANYHKSLSILMSDINATIVNAEDAAAARSILANNLDQLGKIHNRKVQLFERSGRLISPIPLGGYSAEQIPFTAMNSLLDEPNSIEITDFHSKNHHTKVYVPFYKASSFIGILGFSKNEEFDFSRRLYEFLGTLLNVYIFLFLLAGAISIAIANSITQPLKKLTENLKEFKLGKKNTTLHWDTNDEIGILIKDYNKMTEELTKSAEIIAKTERDSAWREMAKQVAHEIKNPLTPMKLSIQYLNRASETDPQNAQKLIHRISGTLIEQINNLTQIADEFSNFATLPKTSNERIILNEIVEHIHDLFRKRDDMDINLIEPINEIFVFADRNQLVRILNNIVKNATQAIDPDRRGIIEIELKQNDRNAILRVSDNGVGIAEDMREKVFTPNFTTKNSGTGLGLAISANMIDSMNGKIYFDSTKDQGTNFYIELPLAKNEEEPNDEVFL